MMMDVGVQEFRLKYEKLCVFMFSVLTSIFDSLFGRNTFEGLRPIVEWRAESETELLFEGSRIFDPIHQVEVAHFVFASWSEMWKFQR